METIENVLTQLRSLNTGLYNGDFLLTWEKSSDELKKILLTAEALKEDQDLADIAPFVSDSGEGRWTVAEAIELDVPAPVITHSLLARLRSRDEVGYADRMLSAMRNQFGGHAIKKSDD